MDVFVVPSTFGAGAGQALAGLIIDGRLALDAGSTGLYGTPEEQARLQNIFLTHCHIDHIASLPVLLDNVYLLGDGCPAVHAPPHTIAAIQSDIFNNRLMPNFVALSEIKPPFLSLHAVEPGVATRVEGYSVTPFEVAHPIPAVAYLVEDDAGVAVAYVTDTGCVRALAAIVKAAPHLQAVFLEASFPTPQAPLAAMTGHLTASEFLAAARSLRPDVQVLAVHVKPRYHAEVCAEIAAGGLANVRVAEPGRTYRFG